MKGFINRQDGMVINKRKLAGSYLVSLLALIFFFACSGSQEGELLIGDDRVSKLPDLLTDEGTVVLDDGESPDINVLLDTADISDSVQDYTNEVGFDIQPGIDVEMDLGTIDEASIEPDVEEESDVSDISDIPTDQSDSGDDCCSTDIGLDAEPDAGFIDAGSSDVGSPFCAACLRFRVGSPTRIFGPVCCPADSQLVAFPTASGISAYSANGTTLRLIGTSPDTLAFSGDPPVLVPGEGGQFDKCGAWLQSVESENGIIRGWYHAESNCNYEIGQTHKSVAYVESYDGGLTFIKVGGPNNQVLTGSNAPTPGKQTGAGDHAVVRWHDAYWMYFIDWNTPFGTGVAISPVSEGGKPGTWKKWYNGAFSEPGLGGVATVIGWFGTAVTHYLPADRLMLPVLDPSFGGIRLRFSSDGINFESISEPLLTVNEESWVRTQDSGELIAYISIMAPNGERRWSNEFFLTYVYLQPKEGFDRRYLVVRKVEVESLASPVRPQVRVALTRTFSDSKKDHWVTTAMTPADYTTEFVLGYVFTTDHGGMTKLVDCYIEAWDDHMVRAGSCGEGARELRTLGWVYATEQPGTVPLHRCYYPAWNDHWVSTTPCDQLPDVQEEFILGWALAN